MDIASLHRIYGKLLQFLDNTQEPYLVQSIEEQALFVCAGEAIVERFDSSTSRFGCGARENSFKTPPGIHRIKEKIGHDAPLGRIFRDRMDTGINWDGASLDDNMILTRILRLEGLENGINRGAGVDSYERFIYIHGTNREDLVGTPLSNGCLTLRNKDMIRLFDMVDEGTVVHIDSQPVAICNKPCKSVHFIGILGTGMSALAQYLRFQGIEVSGSDRLAASEDTASMRRSLEKIGCVIAAQDGSGVGTDTDIVCVSTAIEDSNPDISAARTLGVPIVHRSDILASIIATRRTIAVAGTSGKSTVTAMIFECLTACGKSPSLISGAPLIRLEKKDLIGNAFSGSSDLLVVEADESDGTLVKYHPEIAVILNISKDHKNTGEVRELFETLARNSSWVAVNLDDALTASLPASTGFGKIRNAPWRPDNEKILATSVKLVRNGIEYNLSFPGEHNLENLRAALCVCEHAGCEGHALADGVRCFEGVARRFTVIETHHNVHVIDDFAHNPAKIAAATAAARGFSERIVAVYQPHGFGPTRFLKDEYIATFRAVFRQNDSLYLLPIYYAGGTAEKNIASDDIVNGLGPVPFSARVVRDRIELLEKLKNDVKTGDTVLVMGARDPSLPALTRHIAEIFGGEKEKP